MLQRVNLAKLYATLDGMRRNPDETKSDLRRRQQDLVIATFGRIEARKLNRKEASGIMRQSPARSKARIASTIHETAPDRQREARRRKHLVDRAVISANREAAISQLWALVEHRASLIAEDRIRAGKALHRDGEELARRIGEASRAHQAKAGNTPLVIGQVKAQAKRYSASQRRDGRAGNPEAEDQIDSLAIALCDYGRARVAAMIAKLQGKREPRRTESRAGRVTSPEARAEAIAQSRREAEIRAEAQRAKRLGRERREVNAKRRAEERKADKARREARAKAQADWQAGREALEAQLKAQEAQLAHRASREAQAEVAKPIAERKPRTTKAQREAIAAKREAQRAEARAQFLAYKAQG